MADRDHGASGDRSSDEAGALELTDDDKVLRQWFSNIALQDQRYKDKVILKLAALAMHSAEFRHRVVHHTKDVLDNLGYAHGEVDLKVHDNTEHTLHLVLPPRPQNWTPELRELLRSRTSIATFESLDDWDFGDIRIPEDSDRGDPAYDSGHPADPIAMSP